MTGAETPAVACEYFALCDRPADGYVSHPILTAVPCCERCAERVGAQLLSLVVEVAR